MDRGQEKKATLDEKSSRNLTTRAEGAQSQGLYSGRLDDALAVEPAADEQFACQVAKARKDVDDGVTFWSRTSHFFLPDARRVNTY